MNTRPASYNLHDVLLATAASGGTISAVRELSKSGVRVGVISSQMFCAAAWSRFAAKSYKGPSEKKSGEFLELLLEIGAASPGQVLLPTSDETAWLYSFYAPVLEQHYRLHQPPIETINRILDKKLLSEAVVRAGLAVLPTWEPRSLHEVETSAIKLQYPILIKPRTHVRRIRNDKGMVAASKAELIEKLRKFISREHFETDKTAQMDTSMPILQHYVEIGAEGVHSVSGYIDESGELFVSRHAKKVFQRSQPAGVGVCFESLPAEPGLAAAVHALCRELGYFGIFEVEFIRFSDQWAVIDFNPRLFNQAGMDAHRGMPLALLAYLDAAGKMAEVRELVAKTMADSRNEPVVFYDRFTLWAILMAKALTRRASSNEYNYWRNWMRENATHSVDFAAESSDRMPGIVHAISELFLGVKAARRFLGQYRPLSLEPQVSAKVLQ